MQYREIPYNYTSFSDEEIVARFLGDDAWNILNKLRSDRKTGRSARMLFEVLGDIWVINRNPYIQEDLVSNKKRRQLLIDALYHRINQIKNRADDNKLVTKLIAKVETSIVAFEKNINGFNKFREKVRKKLLAVTNKNNIRFDPMSRAISSTDATDWRVEIPLIVICPDNELEVQKIVKKLIELKLSIIPRGGGTGYTGSAVPLFDKSAVINCEKLTSISPIGLDKKNAINFIEVGTGVVTKKVSDIAYKNKLIFAVDPTSQDACTIGGNIAMNAGGKKAVRYGTTIDNLLSWKMVRPDCSWLEVERLNHNKNKISLLDEIEFKLNYLKDDAKTVIKSEIIKTDAKKIRKSGLGKDVTNKFLHGIPGIQKEGCDGIITSAKFILHKPNPYISTICLEFFNPDLRDAVTSIAKVKELIDDVKSVDLMGMEHLDYQYVRALNYTTKANRLELPKMILIIDISATSKKTLNEYAENIVQIANNCQGEGFIAKNEKERALFWKDRINTAQIASHTNAFKINEDVVISLDKLAKYSDRIEHINIRLAIENRLKAIIDLKEYLNKIVKTNEFFALKSDYAFEIISNTKGFYENVINNLNDEKTFRKIQANSDLVSFKILILKPLDDLFTGELFAENRLIFEKIYKKHLKKRIFIATHMHAGDGNIHTNIPVHSHDIEMLKKANEVVDEIMDLVKKLDGVISGEHGIGITKYKYLDNNYKKDFIDYKKLIDPDNNFNKGKLLTGADLRNAYTPSLRLVEQEAIILEDSELGNINQMIKNCLRCGKCKPICTTHVPEANLLYSPRDKIIATNLVVEAFLYEEQTRRGISFNHFDELNEISDHCTICHLCLPPCPVNIDFGDVSVAIRSVLNRYNKKKTDIFSYASMAYLNATNPFRIKLAKRFIDLSYKSQRIIRKLANIKKAKIPDKTTKSPNMSIRVKTLLDKPFPKDTTTKPFRALLKIESSTDVYVLTNKDKTNEKSAAVFYFPGCGSERLFSQIGLATLALIYHTGAKIILPPGYLCCGYPQNADGDINKAKKITTDNRVLLHRVANTLNYLDIKTVITSCGTCIDQLYGYEFDKIFKGSSLIDIHEYLYEKNIKLAKNNYNYLYHQPCHNPIKNYNAKKIITKIIGSNLITNDRCCGDSGTFAISRPDIAKQVKFKKEKIINEDLRKLNENKKQKTTILTTCPACRQGLAKYANTTKIDPKYPIEILAENKLGDNWQSDFIENVQIENVLL